MSSCQIHHHSELQQIILNNIHGKVKSSYDFSHLIIQASQRQNFRLMSYEMQPKLPNELCDNDYEMLIKSLDLSIQDAGTTHPIMQYLEVLTANTKEKLQKVGSKEKEAILIAYREEVGSIIYLADKDPEGTANLLNASHLEKSRLQIDRAIQEDFTAITKQLDQFYVLQQLSQFPNPSNSLSICMTATLAQMLITNTRCFNALLVPKIIEHFLSPIARNHNIDEAPYKKRMKDVLLTLMDAAYNPEGTIKNLQEQFRQIQRPKTENPEACLRSTVMIKSVLGLSKSDEITQKDAAVTVLFHLLGWSRQVNTGSCFAEWLQIEILAERLDIAFSDVKSLIECGALFRKINEEITAFEFMLSLPNSANARPIKIDATGKICPPNQPSSSWYLPFKNYFSKETPQTPFFWETSPYQAALKIWGIPIADQKALYTSVLNKLLSSSQPPVTSTMTHLISVSAELWCQQQCVSKDQEIAMLKQMLIEGNYAADALEYCATQRAWISAAATFQEAPNTNQKFITYIATSILQTLNQTVSGVNQSSIAYKAMQKELEENVKKLSQIQYNMASMERNQKYGFYVLHEKDLLAFSDTVDSGTPVLTARDFQQFSEKALNIVIARQKKHHLHMYNHILHAFRKAMQNSEFVSSVSANFQQIMSSPFTNGITEYPWKFWAGGFAYSTYKVGMGQPLQPEHSSIVDPKQIMELANWYLTGLYNYCVETGDWDFKNSPPYMCGSMQGHVFNWFIGNATVQPIINYMRDNSCNAETAFNAILLPEAETVNKLEIPLEMLEKLFASIALTLKQGICGRKLLIEDTNHIEAELDALQMKFKKMPKLTIGTLCNAILDVLEKKITDPEAQELLELELASVVLNNIDDENFRQYIKPTILAADSNWEDDTGVELRKICFFMSVSPVTLQPIIGKINDLKTRTEQFSLLPNFSKYYAMRDLEVRGVPNPSIMPTVIY